MVLAIVPLYMSHAKLLHQFTEKRFKFKRTTDAVVTFLHHFCQYLLGQEFTVLTNHGAFTWLQQFRNPEWQLAQWLEKLKFHCKLAWQKVLKCWCNYLVSSVAESTTPVQMLKDITCGYSSQQLRDLHLTNECIRQLLQANVLTSVNFAKARATPVASFPAELE